MKQDWLFSTYDLLATLKQEKKRLMGLALFVGLLFVSFGLIKPIRYEAIATIRGPRNEVLGLSEKMQELKKLIDTPPSSSGLLPKTLLLSASVIEETVKNEKLQAVFPASKIKSAIYTPLQNARVAWIGRKKVLDRLPLKDPLSPISFETIDYDQEIAEHFRLKILDQERFLISGRDFKNRPGKFGKPFIWERGSFICTPSKSKGRVCFSLLSKPQAAKALRSKIQINRDPDNQQLYTIQVKHRDRHRACAIANGLVKSYQLFLKRELQTRLASHLDYLRDREEELSSSLLKTIDKEQLDQKHSPFLRADMERLIKKMGHLKDAAQLLQEELLSYSQLIAKEPARIDTLPLLFDQLPPPSELKTRAELHLLLQRAREKEASLLAAIADVESGSGSRAALHDPLLLSLFQKRQLLLSNLADEQNYRPFERAELQQELDLQERRISQALDQVQADLQDQEARLSLKIQQLASQAFYVGYKKLEELDSQIQELEKERQTIQNEWPKHQLLELQANAPLQTLGKVSKLFEQKQLLYHLEEVDTSFIDKSVPPICPKKPQIISLFLLGALFGTVMGCTVLFILLLRKGVSPSLPNLRAQGYRVMTSQEVESGQFLAHIRPDSDTIHIHGEGVEELRRAMRSDLAVRIVTEDELIQVASKNALCLISLDDRPLNFEPSFPNAFYIPPKKISFPEIKFGKLEPLIQSFFDRMAKNFKIIKSLPKSFFS